MTIASEIERLQNVRTDIYDELGNKCVNLDGSSKYADVAPIIKKMPVVCAKIGANKYPVVKIGNQLWTAKNLDEDLGSLGVNEWYYNGRTEKTRVTDLKNRNATTIKSTSIQNSLGNWYDWNTGLNTGSSNFVRPCQNLCIAAEISFSSPLVAEQKFIFRYWGYINKEGGSLEQRDVSMTTFSQGSTTGTITCNEKNGLWRIVRNFNPTIIPVGNSSNEGISFTLKNIRVCFGTTDCGENAISVPTALDNEATYKKYGRLYTWDNVNTNLASLGLQGWHLATQGDYENLVAIDSSGKKFRSKTFSNGTDDFGLNLLASGTKIADGNFNSIGTEFLGWCDNKKRYRNYSEGTNVAGPANTSTGFSVRLVCDLNEDGSIPDGAVIIAEADEESVATLADDEPSTDSEG